MRGREPRIQKGDAAEKRAVRSSQAQVSRHVAEITHLNRAGAPLPP